MIVVFDTNVYVAAIITEGICAKLLRRARNAEFFLVSCPFILKELRRILSRKFKLSSEESAMAMEPVLEAVRSVVAHGLRITDVCRDADDDNVLACAVAAKAEYIVTGDADLLELMTFQGVKILTPRDFEALFV